MGSRETIQNSSNPFLEPVRLAQNSNMGILEMPVFRDSFLSTEEANNLPWNEFCEKMGCLGIIKESNFSFAITPKSVAWGLEDVNIFTGSNKGDKVEEIDDLDSSGGGVSWT
jgi:hypothetical protein